MGTLDGKIALITGGTGALGRVVSAAFVAAGARIVVTYVADHELPGFEAAVSKERREIAQVELTSRAAIDALVARIVATHGHLDVLLNLAGGFGAGPITETNEHELDRLFAMNVKTAFLCTQAVLPTMIRQRRGRIVNVTSRPALIGGAGVSAYAITKAGVAALTRAAADEVREHGVTVNAIAPSTIDTPANRAAMPKVDPARWVKPEEIAATLVFLASDAAAATSGAIIPVYARA
ncbi:MAG: SDR family oxidoreductase [Deltaproteobacteria bacterium]|nr:SDR family oxidoreductase [Deltaproteobacteria bacterium]